MIGILDLELGNLRSVSNAVYNLGYDFTIINNRAQFDDATHLIIPGVGSYNAAMQTAGALGIKNSVREFAQSGRPVLGICLGMQLLSEHGEEGGSIEGFGLIPGTVKKMQTSSSFPLPHVGWNGTRFCVEHPVFQKIKTGVDFYFVHSYSFVCTNRDNVFATTEYDQTFCSIAGHKNIIGFQFHPEKSQANGLQLLNNFCEWDGRW